MENIKNTQNNQNQEDIIEVEEKKSSAQEWLNKKYPEEGRKWVKEIHLTELDLEGELDLTDFVYRDGVKVYTSYYIDETTELKIKKKNEKTEIILTDPQKYINQKYPTSKERKKSTFLNIEDNLKLKGILDLSDFANLKELDCSDNYLTNLILPSNSTNLEILNLSNNNFPEWDLSYFSNLVNLKVLNIGNHEKGKIYGEKIYNHFFGSLKPLQKLTKLKKLDISNTDIDSGLEYLPSGVKSFFCLADKRYEAKVGVIAKKLEGFVDNKQKGSYNLWELVENSELHKKEIEKLEEELTLSKEVKVIEREENRTFEESKKGNTKLKKQIIKLEEELEKKNEEIKLLEEKNIDNALLIKENELKMVKSDYLAEAKKAKFWISLVTKDEQDRVDKLKSFLNCVDDLERHSRSDERKKDLEERLNEAKSKLKGNYLSVKISSLEDKQKELTKLKIKKEEREAKKKREEQEKKKVLYQEILKRTEEFLKVKKEFLANREKVISELKEFHSKEEDIDEILKIIGKSGEVVSSVAGGLVKAVNPQVSEVLKSSGETVSKASGLSETILSKMAKGGFQKFLENEKSKLSNLDKAYKVLINIVHENKIAEINSVIIDVLNLKERLVKKEIKPFNNQYKIYDIYDGILEGKSLKELKERNEAINLLTENIKKLKEEIVEEQSKFDEKFKAEIIQY